MSDGARVFKELKKALKKIFPPMSGHEASHFSTLLHMITGMIVSKHCHLPKVAGKIKSTTKQESIIAKLKRWISNNKINGNTYFVPFIEKLLPILTTGTIRIIFDGSVVGKDSACLMASIIYKNRAIPIAWLMGEGRKGHFSEGFHLELLKMIKEMLPDNVKVVIIGDGEFDGVGFLETISEYGWYFSVRTAKNSKFFKNGDELNVPKKLKFEEVQAWEEIKFTNKHYGPLMLVAWRPEGSKEIIFLISNEDSSHQITQHYKKRQKIETLFSDIKTKGFHLHKSHLSDLKRLGNLMIAACIGYIWLVLLGNYAFSKGLNTIFHRTKRCDLSLLQIGLRYIEYLINNNLRIPKINFMELE